MFLKSSWIIAERNVTEFLRRFCQSYEPSSAALQSPQKARQKVELAEIQIMEAASREGWYVDYDSFITVFFLHS